MSATGEVYLPKDPTTLFKIHGAVLPEVLREYAAKLPNDDHRKESTTEAINWTEKRIGKFIEEGGGFTVRGEPVAIGMERLMRSPRLVNHIRHEGVSRMTVAVACQYLNVKGIIAGQGEERGPLTEKAVIFYIADQVQNRLFYTKNLQGGMNFIIYPNPVFPFPRMSKGAKLADVFARHTADRLHRKGLESAFSSRAMVNSVLLQHSRPVEGYIPTI